MATETLPEAKPSAWPQPWQLRLFAFPLVVLVVYFLAQWGRSPEDISLLWREAMGVKMLIGAVILLVVGAGFYLGGCALLNHFVPGTWGTGATIAQGGLLLAWLILFCLPVAFVITVGPAAVSIQQNLQAG